MPWICLWLNEWISLYESYSPSAFRNVEYLFFYLHKVGLFFFNWFSYYLGGLWYQRSFRRRLNFWNIDSFVWATRCVPGPMLFSFQTQRVLIISLCRLTWFTAELCNMFITYSIHLISEERWAHYLSLLLTDSLHTILIPLSFFTLNVS